MASNQIKTRIINKHDTAANWELAVNFIPKQGEIIIYDKDSTYNYERFKIGDGATLVSKLPFANDALKAEIQTSLDEREVWRNGNPVFVSPVPGTKLNAVSNFFASGKNLLPISGSNLGYNGISYTRNNDGSVSIKGTATETSTYQMYTFRIPFMLENGTYVFSLGTELPTGVTARVEAYKNMDEWDGWSSDYSLNINAGEEYGILNASNEYELMVYISVEAGKTVDFKIWPQIEAGNTPTSYVPFLQNNGIESLSINVSNGVDMRNYSVDLGGKFVFGEFDWSQGILNAMNTDGSLVKTTLHAYDITALDGMNTVSASAGIIRATYLANNPMRAGVQEHTRIPVLWFYGDATGENKDNEVELEWKYNNKSGRCTRKWQGSSSIAFEKKNYTIKFKEAFDVGFGVQKKYCLKANYIDHSHARNLVSAKLWGEIVKSRDSVPAELVGLPNGGAVDGFPVIIMMNDEFHGLYTWNIPKDKWMFGLEKNKNLLPIHNFYLGSAYGVSYTRYEDGKIHVSGTATGKDSVVYITEPGKFHLPKGTYTLSMGKEMPDGMRVVYECYSENGNSWISSFGSIGKNSNLEEITSITGEITNETHSIVTYIKIDEGYTVDIILEPQLESGNKATDYIKYMGPKQAIVCAEVDAWFHKEPTFNSDTLSDQNYEIEYVSTEDESWVKESLTTLINACRNSDGSDIDTTIAQYIDINSAIDYMIFTSLVCGTDMVARNYLLTTFDGVKWFFSAYDMDSTFGMRSDGSSIHGSDDSSVWQSFSGHVLMNLLKEHKSDAIKARYAEITSWTMSEDNVNKLFWEFTSKIPKEIMDYDVQTWRTIPCTGSSNVPQILSFYRLEKKQIDSDILGYSVGALPPAIDETLIIENGVLRVNEDILNMEIVVDEALSDSSNNPVQNKVINKALKESSEMLAAEIAGLNTKINNNLTNLNASNITSGILDITRGGTGASSIEGAQNILSIMPKSEIQKLYCSMIPSGISIPSNADLNTIDYIKVGNYYCSYSDAVKTLINCPTSVAFMMQVYSPLSETYDNESTSTWCYRLRKIITHTGEEYYQKVNSNDTKGNFYYEPWYKIIRSNNLVSDSDNGLMTSALFTKLNNISDSADSVNFSPVLTSGTKIGTITINGAGTDLYCQTNTDTTYTNGTGLSLNGTTFSLAASGVTAGTYGPSAAVTGSNNTTMNIPEITVDSYGRVTKVTNRVYTSKDTSYTLPNATSSTLGGVKIGSNIAVSNGTISLTKTNVTDALGYTPPTSDTNTTYTIATGDGNGQIKVTPSSGNAYNVNIKGLGSAAYKDVVGVSNGGTGSSNADTACANLGAVKKSGDTMTGNLTVPSLKINTNNSSNELQTIQMYCPSNNALSGKIICDAKPQKRRISFSVYHWDQDETTVENDKRGERYRLPEPDRGITGEEKVYDILTTKQVQYGSTLPNPSSHKLGDIFFLY